MNSISGFGELTKIRKNPKYYKNLSVLTQWNSLFAEPASATTTINQATQYLMGYSNKVKHQDQSYVRSMRTTIALSKDTNLLKTLAYHENIHIALASYYALSKLIPKEVASDILSHAIYRDEKIEYSYITSGDVEMGGNQLTLGEAAYDLFSDHLSTNKMRKIMYQDPLLASNNGQRSFKLRSKQVFYVLMHRDIHSDNYDSIVSKWKIKRSLQRYEVEYFKYLIKTQGFVEKALQNPVMTEKLAQAIFELSEEPDYQDVLNYDIEEWIYVSFKVHNEASKKLIQFLISRKNPKINIEKILSALNYKYNWPRDWQDLKKKVKDQAQEKENTNK